jgi:hypothetical protein
MKKVACPIDIRKCPHCGKKETVYYFKEDDRTNCDLYYCSSCFKLMIWDGKRLERCEGEAYPNRDKY